MDAKIVKLEEIEKKYLELGDLLSTDEVASDVKQFTKLSKQQAQLKGAFDAYQEYKTLNNTINEANEMLNDEDEEIREMAKMELEEAGKRLPELEAHIQSLLLPKDPEDAYDCLVEIRGAAEVMKVIFLRETYTACTVTMPILWAIRLRLWKLLNQRQVAIL